jgi:hypothetical protein
MSGRIFRGKREEEEDGENYIIRNFTIFSLRKILFGLSNQEDGRDILHACALKQ